MRKYIKSIYKFEVVILLLVSLLFFMEVIGYKELVTHNNFKSFISIIGISILLMIAGLVYKKKRDTNFYRKSAMRIIIAVLLFYFIIISLLGLLLGFSKTLFSASPSRWIYGIIPAFLITYCTERLKYLLIKNNITDKIGIYILTILLIALNIIICTNFSSLSSAYKIFVFICVTLMPVVAEEMLSTYLICNYGFLPSIVYKLIINLYLYVIPITTDLGDYLYGAVNIIMPFTIYYILNKYLKPDKDIREKNQNIRSINLRFITIPVSICLIIIIILVSGIFRYKMVAIASNSMVPIYERGDAIIFEKIDASQLKEGEIIVFARDDILVAHRIMKIRQEGENIYFYTKGDANNSMDIETVSTGEIQGIVRRVVKYIGYPTVWINELFRG